MNRYRKYSIVLIPFIFLIYSLSVFIDYNPNEAFAQGKEWERIRTGTPTAGEGPMIGDEGPSVEYFIAMGDKIEVFVWQNPDISRDVIVGPNGKISCPLIGRVRAVGLTIGQLEEEITAKLSEYVKYPKVTIMIKELSGSKVIILGEINYPGIYTYIGTINLIEVIAMAGDFTSEARQDSVIVVHGNLTENPEVSRINVFRIKRKGTTKSDIILRPNDIVYVPKTFINNMVKCINEIKPILDIASEGISLKGEIARNLFRYTLR